MKPPPFTYIVCAVLLRTLAQILFKKIAISQDFAAVELIVNDLFYLSLLVIFLWAMAWQKALENYSLSFAYPFTAFVPAFSLITGKIFFGESIAMQNVAGTGIILIGIILLVSSNQGAD